MSTGEKEVMGTGEKEVMGTGGKTLFCLCFKVLTSIPTADCYVNFSA